MKWPTTIFLLLLFSCSPEYRVPNDVISKEKFTDLLYEIEIIDALRTQKNNDQNNNDVETYQRYHLVFQKNNVSEAEFSRSFDFYKKHSELYMEITDSIISRLLKEEEIVSRELRDKRWRSKKDQEDSSKRSK